jgi:hypothetical protein
LPGFSTVALTFFFVAAVVGAGVAVAATPDFCRKVCVVSRKRVRSTFFFFFVVGGV